MMGMEKFSKKIADAGLDPIVNDAFAYYYKQVLQGCSGKLGEDIIRPPQEKNLIRYEDIKLEKAVDLQKLAVLKLNGGLGTSMGLDKAKTLLKVKEQYNFLDIIAQQILHLRKSSNCQIPLVFMHSFNTQADCLDYLQRYPELNLPQIPLDFLQNKFPKIRQDNLQPFEDAEEHKTWNPPGHGEIYMALAITGTLDKLLQAGIEYIFISNSDNLGSVVDEKILGYFAEKQLPFMMEVCKRSEMDKKGGHLAETTDGQLILRETAQCPESEKELFEDIERYQYFNTNNLWVNLPALQKELAANGNFLPLALIINPKEVNGSKVYQLESAMGAAISIFSGSKAMVVQRERFAPVKKTNDLLAIRSDLFQLAADFHLRLADGVQNTPVINLDERYYKLVEDFEKRFAEAVPSLKKCQRFEVEGDLYFGKNVVVVGDVKYETKQTKKIENCVLS
ncbi:MAG: UTP--glucose-1-phosphate uridylyltransferase [Candidatus Cloacimonadales bacterium]